MLLASGIHLAGSAAWATARLARYSRRRLHREPVVPCRRRLPGSRRIGNSWGPDDADPSDHVSHGGCLPLRLRSQTCRCVPVPPSIDPTTRRRHIALKCRAHSRAYRGGRRPRPSARLLGANGDSRRERERSANSSEASAVVACGCDLVRLWPTAIDIWFQHWDDHGGACCIYRRKVLPAGLWLLPWVLATADGGWWLSDVCGADCYGCALSGR